MLIAEGIEDAAD